MGVSVTRRISELGHELILAPERFDPRRMLNIESDTRVADLVDVVTDTVSAGAPDLPSRVLVLDTTHAYEGLVIYRHAGVSSAEMGSAKRRVRAGDVIISRLRPYLRQVAYIPKELFALTPDGNDVCVSTEFFVLRSRNGFPAAALLPLLLTESVQSALAAGQEGGHHPRFSKKLLEDVSVPRQVIETATSTEKRVREMAAFARSALLASQALVRAAQVYLD